MTITLIKKKYKRRVCSIGKLELKHGKENLKLTINEYSVGRERVIEIFNRINSLLSEYYDLVGESDSIGHYTSKGGLIKKRKPIFIDNNNQIENGEDTK